MRIPFALLLVLALTACSGKARHFKPYQPLFVREMLAQSKEQAQALVFTNMTVQQRLNSRTEETFPQRVFFSKTFATDENSPVLYYLCGEWTCSETEIDRMTGTLARELKAYVVGAEHRFYGDSVPVRADGFSLDDLQDNSTELAIEDFAIVQRKIMADNHLTGRWLALGGSYAATLAAYYRISHPELAYGAAAFSAPLQVTPEGLKGYESTATLAFGAELRDLVRRATAYILAKAGTPEGDSWIQKTWSMPNKDFNRAEIASILVAIVPQFAQAGKIPGLAAAMSGSKSDEELALALSSQMALLLGEHFWEESPYGVRQDPKFATELVRWLSQAYITYGWLYVTAPNPEETMLPMSVEMPDLLSQFAGTFGLKYSVLMTDYSARMLRKLKTESTRIVLLNGSFDPWNSVSTPDLIDPAREISSIVIKGGKHCIGIGPLTQDPSAPAYDAQQFYLKAFKGWAR